MAKLSQKSVNAFFSPRRRRVERSNRKLVGEKWDADPDWSGSSSSEDDPAHFKLEPKSQLLDFPESPPQYISSSGDDDAEPAPPTRPTRRLVRRSEASSSQPNKGQKARAQPVASTSKVGGLPAKSFARTQWEGKKGKTVGKEKDISRSLTRDGKWTDDEDEEADEQPAAGAVDDNWLVDDDVGSKTKSKGKGKARAVPVPDAPRQSVNRPLAQARAPLKADPAGGDSDADPLAFLGSQAVRRMPKVKIENHSDDSEETAAGRRTTTSRASTAAATGVSLPPSAPTSTLEDLLDAAVGSQVSDSKKWEPKKEVVKAEAPDLEMDDSDSSVLIMDTPPPEDPPKKRTIKQAPLAPVEPSRPAPGKSVVKKVKPMPVRAASSSHSSSSPARAPKPSMQGGPSQRSQRLEQRTAQRERLSPRAGSSSRAGPSRKQPSPRRGRPRLSKDPFEGMSSDDDSVAVRPAASKKRARKPSSPALSSQGSDSDAPRSSKAGASQAASQRRRLLGRRKATPISSDDEEQDEDDGSSSSEDEPKKRARARKKASDAAKRRRRPLDSTEDEQSDNDEEAARSRKRKKMRKLNGTKAVETDDEEGTDSEPDDLEDDAGRLLTLQNRMRSGTERAGAKELARRAMLEKLKKRKQKRESGVTSLMTEDESEESVEEETFRDVWGRDARGRYATEDDSEFEKEFIEEDDQDVDQLELPAAFRSDASQPMELNFNIACQWHVHAIIKGRQWAKKSAREPYFQSPLKRLRNHFISTRNSGVTSQVWPDHFKKALNRFPDFDGFTIKGHSPPCDACRITSRPATRKIELSGKRFDPVTFERIAYDSEESSDEELGGMDSEFNCGRYCYRRAMVYHEMTHWEDAIHEALREIIEKLPDEEDERPANATVRIEGASFQIANLPSKQDPDKVVEWLNKKARWVTSRWSQLSQLLESCRSLDAEMRRWET